MSNASFTKLQNTVVSPESLVPALEEATNPLPTYVEGTVSISSNTGYSFTGLDGGVVQLPIGLCVRTVEMVGDIGATGGGITGIYIGLSTGSGAFSAFTRTIANNVDGPTAMAGFATTSGYCVTGAQYLVAIATGNAGFVGGNLRVRCELVPLRV